MTHDFLTVGAKAVLSTSYTPAMRYEQSVR
jgi:hypothetical protein